MNTNTKFPNPSNNKFGIVLPQVHNVVKPSQLHANNKPVDDNEKEVELSEVYQDIVRMTLSSTNHHPFKIYRK
jgi:hypothetical protein